MDEGAFNSVNSCIGDEIAKVFGCEAEDTGLPYAEKNIEAGSDASISGGGVIS